MSSRGVVARVELAEAPATAGPGAWAAALAPTLGEATYVVLPASPDGRDLAPRIAALLDWPLIANAESIEPGKVTVTTHGGRVQQVLDPGGPFVATLQPGVRGTNPNPAAEVVLTAALPLDWDTTADVPDAEVLEVLPPDAATMDLAEAPRIVGGGAGLIGPASDVDAAEQFARLTAVGEAVGASMGATRVVTDAGWVGHERQIGTTGVVVDPDLYLAFGISGAVQHTAGLGHPEHVIIGQHRPALPDDGDGRPGRRRRRPRRARRAGRAARSRS